MENIYRDRLLTPHKGDGLYNPVATTIYGGLFTSRGYTVTFPSFDPGKPHEAVYHFTGLPDIGRDCEIYLGVGSRLPPDEQAQLVLELSNDRGEIVFRAEGSGREFQAWGPSRGFYELYQPGAHCFRPVTEEQYALRVKYSPGVGSSVEIARVVLWCGGRI
jgi:hypothetical protein